MNTQIYYKLLGFVTDLVTEVESDKDITIKVKNDNQEYFVNIFIDSSNDIQVCHYEDEDEDIWIDWWGICVLEDLYEFFEKETYTAEDMKKLWELITGYTLFLYELTTQ